MADDIPVKGIIYCTIHDMVNNFFYYDRKDDEWLSEGTIEKAIKNNDITIDEIVKKFKFELLIHLLEYE